MHEERLWATDLYVPEPPQSLIAFDVGVVAPAAGAEFIAHCNLAGHVSPLGKSLNSTFKTFPSTVIDRLSGSG
jgi:hypothetical protein